ncbi:MAG: hypothetical protein ACI3XQ_13010 [Eubacteriales bacterium]
MKKAIRVAFCIALSLIFVFLCVGYAQLSDSLTVNGNVNVSQKDGIYITGVAVPEGADATVNSYISTTLNSTVKLGANGDSTVTLSVTFYNNSDTAYSYQSVTYDSDAYSNENIVFDVSYEQNYIGAHGTLTLDLTFSYKDGVVPDISELNSVLKFNFMNVSVIDEEGNISTSNGIDALIDGNTTLNYSDAPYWSSRDDSDIEKGIGGSTTLNFEWDHLMTFDSIALYYYLDTIGSSADRWRGSSDFPASVEFYYFNLETGEYEQLVPTKTDDYKFNARRNNKTGLYEIKLDGSPKWTTLDDTFNGKPPATVYEFGRDITTNSVKIVLTAKSGYHVGLMEVEYIDN